jgi:HK97 gp10 family phage protein
MADGVAIKISGLPEFKSRLQALGSDMEKKIVRSGALAAGTIFRRAAIANAPVLKKPDTRKKYARVAGNLKKAIYSGRSRSKSGPGAEVVVVSVRTGGKDASGKKNRITGRDAFYWPFVEAGHLARGPGNRVQDERLTRRQSNELIKAGGMRSKDRLKAKRALLKASGAKFVPGVFFMKRAFEGSQDAAINAFNSRIEARIQKANVEMNNK